MRENGIIGPTVDGAYIDYETPLKCSTECSKWQGCFGFAYDIKDLYTVRSSKIGRIYKRSCKLMLRDNKSKGIHLYTFPGHIHCINPDKYSVCPIGYEEKEGGIPGVDVKGYLDLGLEDCARGCNERDGCTSIAYDLSHMQYISGINDTRRGTPSVLPEDTCKFLFKVSTTTAGEQNINQVNHLHCTKGKLQCV